MKKDDSVYLKDIWNAIDKIDRYMKGINLENFQSDDMRQDAVIRQLEIIGEAAKNISEKTKKQYSEVEWKKIAGSRDIFIHTYFGVNLERVWDIIKKDLPDLKEKISKIRKDLENAKGKFKRDTKD